MTSLQMMQIRLVPAVRRPKRMISPWLEVSDGGRAAAGFTKEKADCTVRATAEAYGVTYAVAHAALKKAGRKDGCRFRFKEAVEAGKFGTLGKHWDMPAMAHKRVYTFMSNVDKNRRFIVQIKGHVFAVIGGKIRDSFVWSAGCIIRRVWEIQPDENREGRCLRLTFPATTV